MKTTAQEILDRCTCARRERWVSDQVRTELEGYYNGGELPQYFTKRARHEQSLGLGNRHVRPIHKVLRSTMEMEPGPVETMLTGLKDFDRSAIVKTALEQTLGEFKSNYRTLCASVAGDLLMQGRAYAWRMNARDIKFRLGRPLHDDDASTDLDDDSFRWWAFPHSLRLSDIDGLLKSARGEAGKGGWQKDSLEKLKEHIIRRKCEEKGKPFVSQMMDHPFDHETGSELLHCYVYFEKSETRDGRHRKVHMKVVSRYSESHAISKWVDLDERTGIRKPKASLNLKLKDPENECLMFGKENAFPSVHACLIDWLDDARVSGDQKMTEVTGDAEQFLPRNIAIEGMTRSAVNGTSMAMQTHWTAGREVTKKTLQKLQRQGLPENTVAPQGIAPMDKSGIINSSRSGLEIIQALGMSIEEESSANKLPQAMGNRPRTEFAAEANAMVSSAQEAVTLRFTFWNAGWDKLWKAVGETLTSTEGWGKADPAYYDREYFRERFQKHGGKMGDLEGTEIEFRQRRFAGGADRATAVQRLMMVIQNPNAPADRVQWAWEQVGELLFPGSTAHFSKPEADIDKDDAARAILQNSAALCTYLPVPPDRGDRPELHLVQFHIPALQTQMQLAAQRGHRTPEQSAGVQSLIQHAALDAANLPGTQREQAFAALQQFAQEFGKISEQTPFDEAQARQAEMQMKAAKTQNDLANGENLRQVRQAQLMQKQEQAGFDKLVKAKTLGQQDRRLDTEEARAAQEAGNQLLQTA